MDIDTREPIKATLYGADRRREGYTYMGLVYVGKSESRQARVHKTRLCPMTKSHYDEAKLFTSPEGTLVVEAPHGFVTTDWCTFCPEIPNHQWRDDAACFGADPLFITNDPDEMIEQFCKICPVQLECLESGAVMAPPGVPSVWGGIQLDGRKDRRKVQIEQRRKELT